MMATHPRTTACLNAVQSYLEGEFSGQVEAESEHAITVSHDGICHYVDLQPTFLQECPDYAYALRESELADYIRETRPQGRRFILMWQERGTRVRSVPA